MQNEILEITHKELTCINNLSKLVLLILWSDSRLVSGLTSSAWLKVGW